MNSLYTPRREELELILSVPLKRTLRSSDLRLLHAAIGNEALTYDLLLEFRRPQYTRPDAEWLRDMRSYVDLWKPELPPGRLIQLRARLYAIASYFPEAIRVPSYLPSSVLDLFNIADLYPSVAQEVLNITEVERLANFPVIRYAASE